MIRPRSGFRSWPAGEVVGTSDGGGGELEPHRIKGQGHDAHRAEDH